MIRFGQLDIREKSGGRHDGATPDYRAFLYYKDAEGALQELRGYGDNPVLAAQDAWERYIELLEEQT